MVLTVKDRGLGIPPEQLERIFDMFTQVDATLERARGGLGIGLTLVKRLVEMHGGTVTAHSEGRGRGSQFVVRLPILEADAAELARRDRGPRQSSSTDRHAASWWWTTTPTAPTRWPSC